jgi:XTP/dITP diphosphohydrolase
MPRRILLASGNAKKLAELRALCGELPIEILSPADLPDGLPDVVEDGDTFTANAVKKALAAADVAAAQLGNDVWALADDSGLRVDALDGAPGVYSARFSGAEGEGKDGANNEKLLQELRGLPMEQRGAAFFCVIAVARPGAVLFTVEGTVRGRILEAADGDQGFGYDPLFFHEASGTTFARLSGPDKAAISHRGEAVRRLKQELQRRPDLESA